MSPRRFDRFMVDLEIGRNLKLRTLSDSEWRGFVGGVLPIAAKAVMRGYLLIGERQATPEDIALQAGVKTSTARSAIEKLRQLGILYPDAEYGLERVHDFEEWNPEPKKDSTNADRQRRYRDRLKERRNADRNAVTNGAVTPVTNADVTAGREEKRKEDPPMSPQGDTPEGWDEWAADYVAVTGHKLPGARTKAFAAIVSEFRARRAEGWEVEDLKAAIVGAHSDDYRREHGYDTADSILRPTKIGALVARGQQRRASTRTDFGAALDKAFKS